MATLATVEDVKRVLGILDSDSSLDAEIAAALEAADEYVRTKMRRTFTATSSQTEKFYDVPADGIIHLAETPTTITSVVDKYAADLDYAHQGGRVIRLEEEDDPVGDPREFTPDGEADSRFAVVTVTYVPQAYVPAPVREAVALIAAEFTPETVTRDSSGNITGRIIQEKIGDYGYMVETESLKAGVKGDRIKKALWLLRPYFRRRVTVV